MPNEREIFREIRKGAAMKVNLTMEECSRIAGEGAYGVIPVMTEIL